MSGLEEFKTRAENAERRIEALSKRFDELEAGASSSAGCGGGVDPAFKEESLRKLGELRAYLEKEAEEKLKVRHCHALLTQCASPHSAAHLAIFRRPPGCLPARSFPATTRRLRRRLPCLAVHVVPCTLPVRPNRRRSRFASCRPR